MGNTKVLHIIHGFTTGGAERLVLGYLQDFKDSEVIDIRAYSLAPFSPSIFGQIIKKEKLNVVFGKPKSSGVGNVFFSKMKHIISLILSIDNAIKEFKPDVIHTHLGILHLTIIPTIIRRVPKRFHTIHSVPEALSIGMLKFIDRFAFRYCHVIPICLTEEMKEKAKKFYRIQHCQVIRNGIDLAIFSKSSNGRQEAKAALGIPDNAFVIGHMGRLCKTKNQLFLIDVFSEIRTRNPNAVLLLLGDGPLKEEITKKIKDLNLYESVKLLGVRDDVVNVLKGMDVFIFPSLYEGLGIALVEAQAVGIRCVVSDKIPTEAIVTEETVVVSLNKSPADWADIILDGHQKGKKFLPLSNYDRNKTNEDLTKLYLH